jgi:O-antigen ligase
MRNSADAIEIVETLRKAAPNELSEASAKHRRSTPSAGVFLLKGGSISGFAALCLGLLIIGGVIGVCTSADRAVSLQKLGAIVMAAFVFAIVSVCADAAQRRLVWLLLLAGVAASLAGNVLVDRNAWKLNALNQPVYALFEHVPRFSDLAFSQNGLAAFLVVVIPVGCALAIRGRSRWLARFLTAGLIAELLLTDSRAAVISLALAASLITVYTRTAWRWLALLAPLIAVGAIAAGVLGAPSTSERLAIWESASYMLADHPITGVGLGMFQRVYPDYMLPAFHNTHPHAHNLFLQTWLDMGMLGAMGMIGLAVVAAAASARLAMRRERPPLAIAAAVASIAMLLHAQVDSYFAGDPRTYWLMFVPLGLLIAQVGPLAVPRGAWLALALPLFLLPMSQLKWLAERRLGLETGDPRYLQAALNDGPTTERAHFELAQALFASGADSRAIQEWRLAKATPYLLRQGRYDLAQSVDPSDPEAKEGPLWTPVRPALHLDKLGRAAELAGNSRQAEMAYEDLSKSNPVGSYRLGELYLRAGKQDQAITQLEKAVQAIPNQEDFRLALAQAYSLRGDGEEARREYLAVLDLDPGSAQARAGLLNSRS